MKNDDIVKDLEQMGDTEFVFLCKCAEKHVCDTDQLLRQMNISKNSINIRMLFDKNYLIEYYWTYNFFNSYNFVPLITVGWKRHPEIMKNFSPSDSAHNKFLWEYVNSVLSGKKWSDRTWNTTKEETYYNFRHFVGRPEYWPLLTNMPVERFSMMIHETKFRAAWINEDYLWFNYDELTALMSGFKKIHPNDDISDVEDEINLFNYFLTGELKRFTGKHADEYNLAIEAIKSLYRRDVTNAYTLFQEALKKHNQISNDKNFFNIPQLTFYLTLCYAITDNEESRKKASQLIKKKLVKEEPEFRPSLIIAEFMCLNRKAYELPGFICSFKDDSEISNLMKWYNLFSHYFNIRKDTLYLSPELDKHIPRDIFLRYELSGYLKRLITEEEKIRLKNIIGGEPLFSGIGRKSDWEKSLDEILDILTKETDSKKTAEKRFAYFFHYSSLEIRNQKRMQNGEWKTGGVVSSSTFTSEKTVLTDETDKKVQTMLQLNYCYVSISEIIPLLIGSNKVYHYTTNIDNAKPVKIFEEKVYISVKKNQNGVYEVTSNVQKNEKISGTIVTKMSDTEYVVKRLSPLEQTLLTKFRDIHQLPAEAEKHLTQVLKIMGQRVEIHSPLVAGTEIEIKELKTVISLLVKPRNNAYELKATIQPLPEGNLELIPGKGNKTVFDTANGKRFEIRRDLNLEIEYFNCLINFMYSSFDDIEEMDEDNKWLIDPQSLLDLLSFVKENEEIFNIKWPEGKEVRIKAKVSSGNISASLKHKENWFEMEGNVSLGKGSDITIKELLALFNENGCSRFVKLSGDEYLELEDSLRKQLKQLDDIAHLARRIPMYQIGALADMVYGDNAFIKTDKAFKELEKKIEDAATLNPEVPKLLKGELRDYQYNGFVWMARLASWGAGACLADEMGLGKTIQTIALMLYRKGPHLVTAPASVVFNWANELERFAPSLNVTILNEAADSRESVVSDASKGDVVLCSYGILQREEELISSKKWDLACLDEAHTIKNHGTKTSMAAMKIQADCRIALTGTPVQNNLAELWNIFQFINPGILGSHESFLKKFGSGSEIKGNGKRLKSLIQPFILRRRKSDVIEELPEKIESQRLIDLSNEETVVYETVRESTARQLESANKIDVNILAQITKLRQAACSIGLIEKTWDRGSSKEDSAIELIGQIVESGNRVLVFSQFTRFLTSVQEKLSKSAPEIQTLYLDGSTPVKKRAELVDKFQSCEGDVFFISLKAGGLGLNLTGANYVIHLDPWWNPAIESQATDRAHRIGQKQNVTVYHLISSHTIEEKILRLHKTKKDMAEFLMEGTDVSQSITMEDLRNLVRDND